jgi:hypothetical protein
VVSIPAHLWFQLNAPLALGVLSGLRISNPGGDTGVPLGIALNDALSRNGDLRFWFLWPDISADAGAKYFGVGVGLEVRF